MLGKNDQKERLMTRSIRILAGAAALAASLSGPAFAQGAPQTVTLMKVDPASLATGYRASKVIGSTVVNEANETVGTIDDLIVTPTASVPYAVLSVGGFLGMGSRYVVVPFSSLQVKGKQMVLPGATKDSLTALPAFKYNTKN
jgi:PRC-barrel domain